MALLYTIRTEGEFTVYKLTNRRTWLFFGIILLWFSFFLLGYYQILTDQQTGVLIFLDSIIGIWFVWELKLFMYAQAGASTQKKINGKGFTEVWLGPKA